mmetsp:Transcript_40835/g.53800  ORF Transcript_40835/g.53800 Transcript_40835/m.53800 type:complete len:865 (+) Transcript_40835:26-2620(+)
MATVEELRALIKDKGDEIRKLKSEGADKGALGPHIAELTSLKDRFKEANGGVPFDPPKPKKEKKEKKPPPQNAGEPGKNKDKKEARKAEKKAKRAAAKQVAKEGGNTPAPQAKKGEGGKGGRPRQRSRSGSGKGKGKAEGRPRQRSRTTSGGGGKPKAKGPTDTVLFSQKGGLPVLAYLVAKLVHSPLKFAEAKNGGDNLPSLGIEDGVAIFGDFAIARYIARSSPQGKTLSPTDATVASAMDQWLDLLHAGAYGSQELADLMEPYLESRTYLAGYALSLADIAVSLHLGKATGGSAVKRWHKLIRSEVPEISTAAATLTKLCSAPAQGTATEGIAQCPPLEGAVVGEVVTRFPPEPSGYLHIGHAKAVMLNNYYARHYKGKLIVRFDDTNPSKEKDEFVENIMKDLKDMGVVPDIMTHTSDSFDLIYKMALKMIKEGKAFMDDTPQEQMREERMSMINSSKRDTPPEENLKLFEAMCKGDPEAGKYCLRAKINMQSVNGTMRDPVLYRQNLTPHVKTGTKYKAYPTYDFACPIVDSIEGVTHALRTTEYNDRDEQYAWIQEALGMRPVHIHAFSRLNFVQTVLSKRKLAWFVDTGKVEGWNDPRFPTIQGVIRRGFSIDALRDFILSQGASRRVVNMQWDVFWATNKKYFEPTASRYMAVFKETSVPLLVTNGPDGVTGKSVPLHPQHPEFGDRVVRLSKNVLLEGDDANQITEGEEIVLMRWGVVKITVVEKSGDKVVSLEGEYLPDGNVKKAKKKLTWLADCPDLIPVKLVEFDYLITKETIEEDENFEDFVNENTMAATDGLGDPGLRNIQRNQVIQLERRGFFRCDRPYLGPSKPLTLFMIPDGKTKAMSSLSSALKHR